MADISQEIAAFEEASRGEEVRDAMVSLANKLNTVGPATTDWSTITNTPTDLDGYGVDSVPASMVSGVLGVENIPPAALERLVPVADDAARFALTTAMVQLGDTVKVLSTGLMYVVTDTDHLDSESGYTVYTAGSASAVPWSGVQNKPTTRDGYNLTDVYTKTETDNIVDDLENPDEHTVTAGNPITFETESAQMAKATKITFEPIQDLHGYDHPWPAGGGKNLLPNTASTQTINGVTFTVNSDGSVKVTGSPTARTVFYLCSNYALSSGTYRLSGGLSGSLVVELVADGTYYTDIGNGQAVTISADTTISAYIIVTSGASLSGQVLYPQLELGSTATSYEPYSNICPISGVDEVEVKGCGFNIWDEEWESGGLDANGVPDSVSTRFRSKNYVPIRPSEDYCLTYIYGNTHNAANVYVYFYDDKKQFISTTYMMTKPLLFTTPANAHYLKIRTGGDSPQSQYGNDVCINVSDIAKNGTYEAYRENIAEVPLPATIYSGTLDLETGELVVDMALADMSADFAYGRNTSYASPFFQATLSIADENKSSLTTIYKYGSFTETVAKDKTYTIVANTVRIRDDDYDDATAFRNAMRGQKIAFHLKTPITYQLTPQQLALFLGTNVVSTNAKKVSVTYRDGMLATLEDAAEGVQVLGKSIDGRLQGILGNFASIEEKTATANHAVGDYIVVGDKLMKVTAAIASGESVVVGTNVAETDVGSELSTVKQLGSSYTNNLSVSPDSITINRRGNVAHLHIRYKNVEINNGTIVGVLPSEIKSKGTTFLMCVDTASGVPLSGAGWIPGNTCNLTYYGDNISSTTKVTFEGLLLIDA